MADGVERAAGPTALLTVAARARGDDPFAEPLLTAIGSQRYQRIARGDPEPGDDDGGLTVDLLNIGTRYFDEFLAEAGRAGIRQAVLLAAGLDTRAYRLWWPGAMTIYELDRPELLEFKTRALRAAGAAPTGHRRAVGIDLGEDWPAALGQIGFDAAAPSVWIAQGLLLSALASEVGDRLLAGISELSCGGSRFAADLSTPNRPYTQNLDGRHDIAGHLQAAGWATTVLSAVEVAAGGHHRTAGRAPIRYLQAIRR